MPAEANPKLRMIRWTGWARFGGTGSLLRIFAFAVLSESGTVVPIIVKVTSAFAAIPDSADCC